MWPNNVCAGVQARQRSRHSSAYDAPPSTLPMGWSIVGTFAGTGTYWLGTKGPCWQRRYRTRSSGRLEKDSRRCGTLRLGGRLVSLRRDGYMLLAVAGRNIPSSSRAATLSSCANSCHSRRTCRASRDDHVDARKILIATADHVNDL